MEEYRVALNQNEKDLLAEEKAQAAIGAYEDGSVPRHNT